MSLGDSPDGRVAAHLADRVRIERDQSRAGADARRDVSGFAAGVTCADYDYLKLSL
jgi:hypothetical protein